MQKTVMLEDDLVSRALAVTGVTDESLLIQEALRALQARAAARRLADMGGTQPDLEDIPRLRFE